MPIDAQGDTAVDPTENVLALVAAANQRQDDLREAQDKFMAAAIQHVGDLAELRAQHSTEMRAKETDRLDSIRQVDVQARDTAADRAADAIQALAATTATNAENLRTALANTAAAIAKQTADTATTTAKQMADQFAAITERIAALEKSNYEGVGKQRLADPQLADLVMEMRSLRDSRAQVTGKGEGIGATWTVLLGAVALISTVGSVVFGLSRSTTHGESVSVPQPIVIQVPTEPTRPSVTVPPPPPAK